MPVLRISGEAERPYTIYDEKEWTRKRCCKYKLAYCMTDVIYTKRRVMLRNNAVAVWRAEIFIDGKRTIIADRHLLKRDCTAATRKVLKKLNKHPDQVQDILAGLRKRVA